MGRRGKRKQKKTQGIVGRILNTVVLIIAIAVFAYSAYQLFGIYHGRSIGNKEYANLLDIGIEEGEDRYTVDFEELWKVNSDIVAWIRFDEPAVISYPVVKGKDNEEYLKKTISGFDNTYGSIFVNADNTGDFTEFNTIVYGHRMKNKTMFGALDNYKDKEFWNNYPYFYIYTPDGKELKYRIFGQGIVDQSSTTYQYSFADELDKEAFLNYTRGAIEVDDSAPLSTESRIVTLSTCTAASDENRYIICGVLEEINE